jgi:hypothetical protein
LNLMSIFFGAGTEGIGAVCLLPDRGITEL